MPRDGSDEVANLWAMAAELERQFAAYKQLLAERNGSAHAAVDAAAAAACDDDEDESGGGDGEEVEPCVGDSSGDDVRGRMYEAYMRRRDERLRQGWRARMERKEAEVKAFWAQLELSGRRAGGNGGGGRPATSGAGDDDEGKTERNDQDKKRSSDAALAPRRISGKKHARTRSFSSSSNTNTNHPDLGERRRAHSQEPPPSEPQVAADASKESRARRAGGAAKTTTTATSSRPKTSSLRRKSSVKGHGSAKQTGPKLPRSLPRRANSGELKDDLISKEVVLPTADAAAPLLRRSFEQDVRGEAPGASPPRPSTSIGVRDDGADKAQQTASPGSDRSEVVDVVPEGKHEAKNANMKKHHDEVDDTSPGKVGNPNGEITSDSDIEPNYVYINKDNVKEQAMSLPETRAASVVAVPEFSAKNNQDNAETTEPTAGATATGISTTTNAEEAPARESSGHSSSSGRSGRSPPSSAKTSCSSRDQSIERVLEADAVLLRKMREKQRTEKSTPKTPGSAGSRVSGTARSPKKTPKGFKRFLSFGKKNRAREVTVIDCTSPSVSSVADDDSGRWQSAGSIKPRLGSSDAAGSDGTDHARTTSPRAACSLQSLVAASPAKSELAEIVPQGKSPKAHRPFFSFRSLNCGRG